MQYISKPVEVEAIQYNDDNSYLKMCDKWGERFIDVAKTSVFFTGVQIITLEGVMWAKATDWIIKGTEGEFYPCKDSVFKRKYEAL